MAISTLMYCLPAAADTITLTGVGGNQGGGVFTVPYDLSLNGGASIGVMCDDFTHEVVVGETWQGAVYSYADLATHLSSTRAGASVANGGLGMTLAQAQIAYKEIFWLFGRYEMNPAPSGNTTAVNINFAAWAIFDSNVTTASGWTTGTNSAAYWLAQAQANYGSVNVNNFEIIDPNDLKDNAGTSCNGNTPCQSVGGSSPQEYIATPEPAGLALLGSGLLGLGSFIRRKRA